MSNMVPDKGINFAVYLDGVDQIGLAETELPNLESMTEAIKGAGIAGEFDSPTLGHFSSMKLSLTWRTTTDSFIKLAHQKAHELYLYSAQQEYDAGLCVYNVRKVAIFVKAIPRSLNPGKLAIGASTETKSEFELSYIKIEIDDVERIEIDKFNFICKIEGVDYLAQVRSALGKGA